MSERDTSRPAISVVLPARNEVAYIERVLAGVRAQDYDGAVDITVVDNGSTDGTGERAAAAGAHVITTAGGTISAARNRGAWETSGELLAFLDGDSLPPAEWLSTAVELLGGSGVVAVGFALAAPGPDQHWIERTWHRLNSTARHVGTVPVEWLSSFNFIVRRDAFEAVEGFDESLTTCEDADIGRRLAGRGTLMLSDRLAVDHLDNPRTLGAFFRKELWRGRGNLASFFRNPITASSILSTFMPLMQVLAWIVALGGWWVSPWLGAAGVLTVIDLPVAMVAYKVRGPRPGELGRLWLLCLLYLTARGLALFGVRA